MTTFFNHFQNVYFLVILGMLLVGFALRNIPAIDVANDINKEWSSALRSIALVVILVHAGLGLDAQVNFHFISGIKQLASPFPPPPPPFNS